MNYVWLTKKNPGIDDSCPRSRSVFIFRFFLGAPCDDCSPPAGAVFLNRLPFFSETVSFFLKRMVDDCDGQAQATLPKCFIFLRISKVLGSQNPKFSGALRAPEMLHVPNVFPSFLCANTPNFPARFARRKPSSS